MAPPLDTTAADGLAETPSKEALVREVLDRVQGGSTVKAACEALGVAVPSYYRWRASLAEQPGGRKDDHVQAILVAAKRLFLSRGYDVSMDHIAIEAGVGRQTLFNRFGSKHRLFREVVHRSFERVAESYMYVDEVPDMHVTLRNFGRGYLDIFQDAEVVALHQLAIQEMRKFPDLGRLVQSITRSYNNPFPGYLARQMKAGKLRQCDPQMAAEFFFASAFGYSRLRALMGTEIDSPERVEDKLNFAVDLFLRGMKPG